MSNVSLTELGLSSADLTAIGKLSEKGLTPEQIADAIEKSHNIQSNASEIDAVANVSSPLLAPIHKLFREAANGITDVVFIRVGDSTRSTLASEWQIYDSYIYPQTGVTYFNNAYPSQTAEGWRTNTAVNKMSEAVANSKGVDGENTILEFSMGLNDFTANGNTTAAKDATKLSIKNAILDYLALKPKAKVYLCSPNNASNTPRHDTLRDIYAELAFELNLFLVDGLAVTSMLDFNSTDYYLDSTHMNQYGMLRQNFYIANKIIPLDVIRNINFAEYVLPPTTSNLAGSVITGLYNVTTGIFSSSNAEYRALPKIDVIPNLRLDVTHQGNRTDFCWFDKNGVFLFKGFPTSLNNGYIYVPSNAYKVGINISTSGASYNLLNDTPIIKYHTNPKHFTYDELVSGFKSNITHTTRRNGIEIDGYGNIGKVGETLKIDSNGKMKWSA